MSDSHVNISPIECRLSCLTVFTNNTPTTFPDTILQGRHSFSLQVTVEFLGSGAIALMPLAPTIRVEFYMKPLGPEQGAMLGNIELTTEPEVFVYKPTLDLGPPISLGLNAGKIYKIGSILRVGAPNWPSLISGFTEELTVEVYLPSVTLRDPEEPLSPQTDIQ